MNDNDKPWRRKDIKKIRVVDQNLLNACYFGNYYDVKKFLQLGANPNYMEERDGWRPLHYASRWGHIPMTLLLLKWGAEINGFTNSKETALHKCARWNRKELAKILIKKGALLHYKNSDGNKAMDMTTDPEMKELLNPYH